MVVPFEKLKVSVVIPCYRSEKYLRKTLESVGQQSHPHWEILVVEDGSEDGSEQITGQFQKDFPSHSVRFYRHSKNKGPAAARNTGIRESSGQWIAFLDSDDLWAPSHLESMLNILQQQEADLAYCSLSLFDDSSGAICGKWGPTESDLETFPAPLFLRNFIGPSGVVCKKEIFETMKFDESPKIQSCEDHDLWMRLIRKGKRFVWNPEVEVRYRKNHSESATGNRERLRRADIAVMFQHWWNPQFNWRTKFHGLSKNYALLAEELFQQKRWQALEFFFKSWCLNPFDRHVLFRMLRALKSLTLRAA